MNLKVIVTLSTRYFITSKAFLFFLVLLIYFIIYFNSKVFFFILQKNFITIVKASIAID